MPDSILRAPLASCNPIPFGPIPHELGHALGRNWTAYRLAGALLEYARDKASCWPSNRRLAADLGCCQRTIRYALAALRKAGWIAIRHGADNATGRLIVLSWRVPKDVAAPRQSIAAPPPGNGLPPNGRRRERKRTAGVGLGPGEPSSSGRGDGGRG